MLCGQLYHKVSGLEKCFCEENYLHPNICNIERMLKHRAHKTPKNATLAHALGAAKSGFGLSVLQTNSLPKDPRGYLVCFVMRKARSARYATRTIFVSNGCNVCVLLFVVLSHTVPCTLPLPLGPE